MTSTKPRQPVPRVPPMKSKSRSTTHLPGEFPFTEIPKSGPVENRPENDHKEKTMSSVSKLKAIYDANKDTIKRKVLVGVGATVGMIIATGVAGYLNRPSGTAVIIITDSEDVESLDEFDRIVDIEDLADTSIS